VYGEITSIFTIHFPSTILMIITEGAPFPHARRRTPPEVFFSPHRVLFESWHPTLSSPAQALLVTP
jgi:hypothetical protein